MKTIIISILTGMLTMVFYALFYFLLTDAPIEVIFDENMPFVGIAGGFGSIIIDINLFLRNKITIKNKNYE